MGVARSIANLVARVLLALVLVACYQLAAFPAPAAFAAADSAPGSSSTSSESSSSSEELSYVPTKLTLAAYKVLADQDDFWDVKSGKKTAITERGGQLRVAVRAKWTNEADSSDSFSISETKDDEWADQGGFAQGFTYATSDADIATVDSRGIVTALGKKDGEVTISAVPKNEDYADLEASLTLKVSNQEASLIATKLEIVNAKGKAYGDDNVTITETNKQVKLYVRVIYTDTTSGEESVCANYPDAPAGEQATADELDTLRWNVGDTNYASISSHDGVGYLTGKANAVTQVFASISGGDASEDHGMGYGVLVDYVGVTIENGRTVNGMDPADELTVNVVYEKSPDEVITTKTYTPEELEELGAITRNYTLTRSNGKYVTDRAYGVPLAKVLVDLGIETDDVKYFTMAANDGANPGRITAKWLLKTTRYYLPNYDIGGSWQERVQVPTMIALKDSWNEQTTLTGDLNEGTRFRLVFGSATSADNATDKSIKFINTFTVVMTGSAPSSHGTSDNGSTDTSSGSGGAAGSGSGTASGSGDGAGTTSAGGSGDAPGQSTQGGGGSQADAPSAEAPAGSDAVDVDDSADEETPADTPDVKATELGDSARWRIYQMMNKSSSDLIPIDEGDNPLEPFALPTALAVLVLAGALRLLRYRRQMRW